MHGTAKYPKKHCALNLDERKIAENVLGRIG